jgi:uncharacterized protein
MRAVFCLVAWLAFSAALAAAEAPPPRPTKYFNDYAGMVSAQTAARLERALEDYEKETSSQILVAIFPKLPENSALEDFTFRTADAWKPGQKGKDNGAILFIFRDDRKIRIEVGYGLEPAIPDSVVSSIINNVIMPRFRARDFDGGVSAGVDVLLQAARGEYKGTGTTVASRRSRGPRGIPVIFIVLLVFVILAASSFQRRGTVYHRRRRSYWGGGWGGGWGSIGGLGGGGGGWSGRSGGGSWGGGGGFSSGGGGFGGGGASGGW